MTLHLIINQDNPILMIVLMAFYSYFLLIVVLRVSGKRTLSKMNAFDFVVTVALGSMLSTIILDPSLAIIEGTVAIVLLVGLQYSITYLSMRFKNVAKLVKSEPTLLYHDGQFLVKHLMRERVLQTELEQAIRKEGYENFEKVSIIILESDGSFSIISKASTE